MVLDTSLTKISIINEKKEILKQYKVRDFINFELLELEGSPFLYQETFDEGYWILNYETLEEKYLENPDNLDIYSLIENNWNER